MANARWLLLAKGSKAAGGRELMGQACAQLLIIDQDPVGRDYTARVAENGGYLATEVAHAGEAFSALETDPQIKAVIASNQWHSGIDGIALAGTVRCFWPQVGIVVLTERALPNDADLPLDTVVLTKPFTPQQLLEAIRDALMTAASEGCASPTLGGLVPLQLTH